MKAVSDSLHNFGTAILVVPIAIVGSIVVTRLLGPENRGIFVYLTMICSAVLPIAFLGVESGIQYFANRENVSAKDSGVTVILTGLIVGSVVSGIVYLLWAQQWLGSTGEFIPREILLLFIATLPLEGVTHVSRFLLIGDSEFRVVNYLALTKAAATNLLVVVLILILHEDLLAAVIGLLLVRFVICGINLLYLVNRIEIRWRFDRLYLSKIFGYGIRSWLGNLSSVANNKLDVFIVGYFVGPASLGLYSAAYTLTNLLLAPSKAISGVLFNELAKVKNVAKSAKMAAQVHRSLFFVVAPVGVALCVSAQWIVPLLFGDEFADASLPLMILAPGVVAFSVTRKVLQKILGANGYPMKTSIIQLVGLTSGLVLYFILVPVYGIVGAAIGSTVAYFASTIVAYVLARRLIGSSFGFFAFSWSDIDWLMQKLMSTRSKNKN